MRENHEDAFGCGLLDHLEGRNANEIVERDDGFIEPMGLESYFAPFGDWPEWMRDAMSHVRGRVLDVGCGAGRHALHLQEEGHDVVGIDVSPMAVEVCKRRGVGDVRLCPVTRVGPALGVFDTIIMMGNNFGLVENRKRAVWLLKRFARLTSPEGRILAQTNNVYTTRNPDHLAYHDRNRRRGRMAGQLRLRVRYGKRRTPWFDYLIVSPEEMEGIVAQTSWHIERILGDPEKGLYVAVLEKG